MQMTPIKFGESVVVLPDGSVRVVVPVLCAEMYEPDFVQPEGSAAPVQSAPMEPEEAQRIGSELLNAAEKVRRMRSGQR